jgi:glycosyltransferase involved in cell wall biosynthesis
MEALASGVPIVASDIPSFQFASGQAGVELVGATDVSSFRKAAIGALRLSERFERQLGKLDIAETASKYSELAMAIFKDRP